MDDDAANRRIDLHVVGCRASFLDLRNLLGFEPPQSKLLSDSYNGSLRRLANDADIALLKVLDGLKGLKEFLLGTEQFRAVQGDHVISLLDRNPRIIYEESVQPPGDPGGDVLQAGLVIVDLAHHPHLRLDELPLDRGGLDLHQFPGILADRQFAEAACIFVLSLQRDQFHVAEGTQIGLEQLDLGMHGTRPQLWGLVLLAGCLLGGGTCFAGISSDKHAPDHIPHDEADNYRDHQHPCFGRSPRVFDCSYDTFFHDCHLVSQWVSSTIIA